MPFACRRSPDCTACARRCPRQRADRRPSIRPGARRPRGLDAGVPGADHDHVEFTRAGTHPTSFADAERREDVPQHVLAVRAPVTSSRAARASLISASTNSSGGRRLRRPPRASERRARARSSSAAWRRFVTAGAIARSPPSDRSPDRATHDRRSRPRSQREDSTTHALERRHDHAAGRSDLFATTTAARPRSARAAARDRRSSAAANRRARRPPRRRRARAAARAIPSASIASSSARARRPCRRA